MPSPHLAEPLGRDDVGIARRLLRSASAVTEDELADGEYYGDLFLATANTIALAATS